MRKEVPELIGIIYSDIQSEIWKYYNDNTIDYKVDVSPEETIVDFFSYLLRLIAPIKRHVHYSKELLRKTDSNEISSEQAEVIKTYEIAFSEGKDMNIFLSNNIKKSRETDFLRYTWHLFHLHMSGKFVEDKSQMKNNRSNTQLLCIVDINDVYFIGTIPHPTKAEEYFNINSLQIIINNGWVEKIGFCEMTDMIPRTLEPKITEGKDIFTLYSRGSINIMFEFQEKGYCSMKPMSTNRRPHDAVIQMHKIHKQVSKLNHVEGVYKGFHLARSDKGFLLGLVEFEMSTGEKNIVNVF